eukprot:CAMPEP_0181327812 /NCGR_PEP_ID=MMETSP1101-20121128/22322_1 /TAXON_ID=46948 /ORGANISM="Rhodomonas abbreviata, Strain Caron Lab Isolate" /LENGTH=49 /DNA_ID=CAMNT_0023436539 /DNA_START=175 /DNA_END=324 /DNA_ORIENTATION=+
MEARHALTNATGTFRKETPKRAATPLAKPNEAIKPANGDRNESDTATAI